MKPLQKAIGCLIHIQVMIVVILNSVKMIMEDLRRKRSLQRHGLEFAIKSFEINLASKVTPCEPDEILLI